MREIDGKKYVNEEDAIEAMKKEIERFADKGDSEISFIIGMTIVSFMSTLFKGDEKE